MRGSVARAAEKATEPTAVSGRENAETGVIHSVVLNAIKELAPRKAWAFIADVLGLQERTAKHRADSTRLFSADEIGALLGTDDGFRYLAAISTTWENMPVWYRLCAPLMELADAQRMQLAARKRYERVLRNTVDADRQLTESIAQGQAALLVQDAEFYRGQPDPSRDLAERMAASRRVPHRAVVKKGHKR